MSEINNISGVAFVELSATEEVSLTGGYYYKPQYSSISIQFGNEEKGHIGGRDFISFAGGTGTVNFLKSGSLQGGSKVSHNSSYAWISGYSH
ncbi:MAG: hypothetical protein HC800_10440 [Phormidesmis sp. RL_2_1]|nr:hypothetical protein [Phormidesmis sp. RL_2_1]